MAKVVCIAIIRFACHLPQLPCPLTTLSFSYSQYDRLCNLTHFPAEPSPKASSQPSALSTSRLLSQVCTFSLFFRLPHCSKLLFPALRTSIPLIPQSLLVVLMNTVQARKESNEWTVVIGDHESGASIAGRDKSTRRSDLDSKLLLGSDTWEIFLFIGECYMSEAS